MGKTTLLFTVEVEHEEVLDFEELSKELIEPIKQGIRTACVTGPNSLKSFDVKEQPTPCRVTGFDGDALLV